MGNLIQFETKAEKQARYVGLVTPRQLMEETEVSFDWGSEPEALRLALNVLIRVSNGYEDGVGARVDLMIEMLEQDYRESAKSVSDVYELEERMDAIHDAQD